MITSHGLVVTAVIVITCATLALTILPSLDIQIRKTQSSHPNTRLLSGDKLRAGVHYKTMFGCSVAVLQESVISNVIKGIVHVQVAKVGIYEQTNTTLPECNTGRLYTLQLLSPSAIVSRVQQAVRRVIHPRDEAAAMGMLSANGYNPHPNEVENYKSITESKFIASLIDDGSKYDSVIWTVRHSDYLQQFWVKNPEKTMDSTSKTTLDFSAPLASLPIHQCRSCEKLLSYSIENFVKAA